MVYFLDTEISNTKKLNKSLQNIFGFGKKKNKFNLQKIWNSKKS